MAFSICSQGQGAASRADDADQFGQACAIRELLNEKAQKYDRARQDAERERPCPSA